MTTWFISDQHFGHKNIAKYCGRPFDSVDAMNDGMVEAWNAVVRAEDHVWMLGDFAVFAPRGTVARYWPRLNGLKHVVRGNHDEQLAAYRDEAPYEFNVWSEGVVEVQVEGQRIVLCHYPLREWNNAQKGWWHLHGHVHGLLEPVGKSLDVGVDARWTGVERPFGRPYSFEEVKAFMDARPVGPHAMFGGGEAAVA